MSPTTIFYLGYGTRFMQTVYRGGQGCTRGGAVGWVPEGCYTGYQPEAEIEAYLMNIEVRTVHTAV